MSNNPFSKSGRFSSLDDTDTNTGSFIKKNKETGRNKSYDSSANSFIRRNRDSNRSNHDRTNNTLSRLIDTNNAELFPDLILNTTSNTIINTKDSTFKPSTKFKDILTNDIVDDTPVKKIITPGWVEITKKQNKIVCEYGEPTIFMIKQKIEENLENDLNYKMSTIIQNMKKCWDRYEREYDEVNGEGAYEERYRLPAVYTEEYDTSSEYETDNDDEMQE